MPRRKAQQKIKAPAALVRSLKKTSRKKLVFTNGCFDLIHRGHVEYLQRARALGDRLIVALNSDASVKRLKGPSRPLNGLADRMLVVAALEVVDHVTWFSEDTPLSLIKALLPGTLVKGGDWSVDTIVGAKEVREAGGRVRSIAYIKGQSTTKLVSKAKKSR